MKSKKFLITELKEIFKKELNFNLLLSIEKKFKIKFNPQEFNKLNSFKDILNNVTKKFK